MKKHSYILFSVNDIKHVGGDETFVFIVATV